MVKKDISERIQMGAAAGVKDELVMPLVSNDLNTLAPADDTPLTANEKKRLEDYEKIVEEHFETVVEVGMALKEIKLQKLYRQTHKTFEEYCRDKWGISRVHANRQIEAGGVINNLKSEPIGTVSMPLNERQTRPLTGLTSEEQVAVAQDVKKCKGDKPPTAEDFAHSKEKLGMNKRKEPREKDIVESEVVGEKPVITVTSAAKEEPNFVAHLINEAIRMILSDVAYGDVLKVLRQARREARAWNDPLEERRRAEERIKAILLQPGSGAAIPSLSIAEVVNAPSVIA